MRQVNFLAAAFLALAMPPAVARGQQVVVQQPQFEQFGASSTVLVPDRGATGLGGNGAAAASRGTSGPIPGGTSRLGGMAASRVETRAWVHDFEAMDRAILGAELPESSVSRRSPARPGPSVRPGLPMRRRAAR
jgi:hypothetical protein